jgi:multiple sugar transport system ATP-binding protein
VVPRVRLESLTKVFTPSGRGGVRAVDGLNLEIEDGELVALVGPSACGKTTTLRLIAGLEDATSGTVSIAGLVVNRVPPKERDVAMVFQSPALYPHMTVRENIEFGLKVRKVPRAEAEARVRAVTGMLGLGDCLARRPGELSGGQRQRVSLGRALARRPKLLLLDEPFAQLDAPLRRELRRELLRVHAELGLTTLLVTHDQAEALVLGQRVAVMNRGALEQVATPAEIQAKPATPFVSSFFDTRPI